MIQYRICLYLWVAVFCLHYVTCVKNISMVPFAVVDPVQIFVSKLPKWFFLRQLNRWGFENFGFISRRDSCTLCPPQVMPAIFNSKR